MKNIIVERMEVEIERLLDELTKVDPSSGEYKELIERIGNLYETIYKENVLENDNLTKLEELKQSKIWNGVKTGVEIATVMAPLVFYGIWMNRGLEFEQEGSYTSSTFKGLISKFKPTK